MLFLLVPTFLAKMKASDISLVAKLQINARRVASICNESYKFVILKILEMTLYSAVTFCG